MIENFRHRRLRFLSLTLLLFAVLTILPAGCARQTGETRPTATDRQSQKHDVEVLADQATTNLGDEKKAFKAILSAWDKGYSLKQIIKGIQDKKLHTGGAIDGSAPDSRPQRYLRSAGPEPALLASYLLAAVKLAARPKLSIDEVIEKQKANWTVWLLGVIEKGYSVEQITEFMLEHDRPVEIPEHGIGPVISTARVSDKSGEPLLGMDGKPIQRVVKPAFPPKGTAFNPIDVNGAEQFTSDLAKDFDDLISGKGTLKPARGGRPAKGKFKPRTMQFKLKLWPLSSASTVDFDMGSSDVTLKIDEQGRATGSYNTEVTQRSQNSETIYLENGTFEGQARYPKVKGQMIKLMLAGSRHVKSTTTYSHGATSSNNVDKSEKILLHGDIAVDYSRGSGVIYGGHYYQWSIGNSPLPSEKPKSN